MGRARLLGSGTGTSSGGGDGGPAEIAGEKKGKRVEGDSWLGPWLVASKQFPIFAQGFFQIQGSQQVDGVEGGGAGSVPEDLHTHFSSLKYPWGPGRCGSLLTGERARDQKG